MAGSDYTTEEIERQCWTAMLSALPEQNNGPARASRDAGQEPAPVSSTPLDWRPIDSAPKDGTKIDLLYPYPRGRRTDCYWDKALGWVWRTPRWSGEKLAPESGWDFNTLTNLKPTHWMLPPPLPAENGAGVSLLGDKATSALDDQKPFNPQPLTGGER